MFFFVLIRRMKLRVRPDGAIVIVKIVVEAIPL